MNVCMYVCARVRFTRTWCREQLWSQNGKPGPGSLALLGPGPGPGPGPGLALTLALALAEGGWGGGGQASDEAQE